MVKESTTPDSPFSVAHLNDLVKGYISRLGEVWVEGELVQVKIKPTWKWSYCTLRDTEADASVQVMISSRLATSAELSEGDRVLLLAKPGYYTKNGSFSLWGKEVRHVGMGAELARIEQLRRDLAAEGLFHPERKLPIPILPTTIGLITGAQSHAERDVLTVATDRWPHVTFRIIHAAVQGSRAVDEVIAALAQLDRDPTVDVIIIARGGGSVEDLFPFSREPLIRAVAAAHTPVVSAIGHEPDHPILDDVADLAAKTPTDAAKQVVPSQLEEELLIQEARTRALTAVHTFLDQQAAWLADLRSRPVLASPRTTITRWSEELAQLTVRLRAAIRQQVSTESTVISGLTRQLASLGPAATLARGYAIVQVGTPPQILTSVADAHPGSQLRIRVGDGSLVAATMSVHPAPTPTQEETDDHTAA